MPNLTIKIDDDDLIRRARMYAADRGVSLSALVRVYLERIVREEDEYERARKRAVRWMRRGLDLGGKPLGRDEAHDEP